MEDYEKPTREELKSEVKGLKLFLGSIKAFHQSLTLIKKDIGNVHKNVEEMNYVSADTEEMLPDQRKTKNKK